MEVVANAAVSVDGKLASRSREPLLISGPADLARVDALRADCDAVLVGVGTVLADDPHLIVDDPDLVAARRGAGQADQPTRVVADSRARTPPDARVVDDAAPSVVLASEAAPIDRLDGLEAAGARTLFAGVDRVDLRDGLERLGDMGVDRLLVEGGGELLFSMFDAGLVDELSLYVGGLVVGGREAPTLVDGPGFTEGGFPRLDLDGVERIDDGVLLRYSVVD